MLRKKIMIIAGEASGDMHGAKLAQSLQTQSNNISLFGIGGNAMKEQGVQLLIDAHTLSVVGITEVLSKLRTIYRALTTVKSALKKRKPDLLVVIDFPDFNFLVAAAAKKANIPVLYYISPQIWAWRQNRVKTIKRLVNHMAVIFPFEAPFYRKHRVPVTFVGHPLLDRISPVTDPYSSAIGGDAPVIGLVPGSREKEVATLLPIMLDAATIVQKNLPKANFLISCAHSVPEALISNMTHPYASTIHLEIAKGPVEQVFKKSHLLVAASGTVTLEAALHGIPAIIVYKVSPMSYQLGKRLIKVKHIGIVNLIAEKELLPEFIQDNASPPTIARAVTAMIDDPEGVKQTKYELLKIREKLGGHGASDRVAQIAMKLMRSFSRKNP